MKKSPILLLSVLLFLLTFVGCQSQLENSESPKIPMSSENDIVDTDTYSSTANSTLKSNATQLQDSFTLDEYKIRLTEVEKANSYPENTNESMINKFPRADQEILAVSVSITNQLDEMTSVNIASLVTLLGIKSIDKNPELVFSSGEIAYFSEAKVASIEKEYYDFQLDANETKDVDIYFLIEKETLQSINSDEQINLYVSFNSQFVLGLPEQYNLEEILKDEKLCQLSWSD